MAREVAFACAPADRDAVAPCLAALADTDARVTEVQGDAPSAGESTAESTIAQADVVVAVWSRAAAEHPTLPALLPALIRAWSSDRLILARLDDTALPTGLGDLPAVALRADDFGTAQDVVRRVEALLPSSMLRPPAEPPEPLTPAPAPPMMPAPAPIEAEVGPAQAPPPQAVTTRSPRKGALGIGVAAAAAGMLCIACLLAVLLWTSKDAVRAPDAGAPAPGAPAPGAPPAPVPASPPREPMPAPAPPLAGGPAPPAPRPSRPAQPPSQPAPPRPVQPAEPAAGFDTRAGLVVLLLGGALGAGLVVVWASLRGRRRPGPAVAAAIVPQPRPMAIPKPAPAETPQVFVSYSRKNESAVDAIVGEFEQLGYAVWIDRQTHGGDRYAAKIVGAIKESSLVALMCSRDSFASDHVTREVYVAGDYRKRFIAFQLDPVEIPDEFLYFLSGFPRIEVDKIDPVRLRGEIARLIAA